MGLSPTTTTTTVLEDRSWLGSQHGTDSTFSKTVDGDSVRARFAAGEFLPSGVVIAGDVATGKGALYSGTSDEVQTLTVDATGGTFTLTFAGQTTAAIASEATAAAVEAALEALSNVAPGDVTVTGAAGGPYTITFGGDLANTNVAAITTDATALTGGAGTAVVTTGTAGGADLGDTAIGHLFSGQTVPAAGDLHCALLDVGRVIVANLPEGSGFDQAVKADLTHIRYVD